MRKLSFLLLTIPIMASANEMFAEKNFEDPIREISVIVTDDGYFPNKISAFEGEKIRFFVTSTAKDKQCFILQKHELFLGVDRGSVNEGEIKLNQAGRFRFFCPSNKKQGYLTVLKKEVPVEEVREPASVPKPIYWTPRDSDRGEY